MGRRPLTMVRISTLRPVREGPSLSLAEWTVLAVVSERPAHGFAIAALTAPGGELGRVWQIPRPVVYRALGRLVDAGMVSPDAVEAGRGPLRTVYAVTPLGRESVRAWLAAPVGHVRDVRSHLLLKLALLDRLGSDPRALLARQKAALAPIAEAVAAERAAGPGFDAILLAWRQETTAATMRFLDAISASSGAHGAHGGGRQD